MRLYQRFLLFERLRVLEKIGIRMLQIRNVCYVVSVNLLQKGVTSVLYCAT